MRRVSRGDRVMSRSRGEPWSLWERQISTEMVTTYTASPRTLCSGLSK